MYDSPNYPSDPAAVDRFVASYPAGLLVATAPGGHPQVTMLPFLELDGAIELHGVQADPTIMAARDHPRVSFAVSDFLAFTPHHWVDERNAARATLNYRLVVFEGTATVSTDPTDVAAVLRRLLEAYEPKDSYEEIADGEYYGSRLRRLAAVRIQIERRRSKMKVGPYGPPETKRSVSRQLRARGLPGDDRAADIIEADLSDEP